MVEKERIVTRRTELGMSQAELARRVGVSQPAIVEIEKGRVRSTKYVVELANALRLTPREIDPAFPILSGGTPASSINAGLYAGSAILDLPVFKITTQAGGGRIEADPVNAIPRPAVLLHVPGAYAVMASDAAMAPEFEPGDLVLVNPHLPVIAGHSYLFRAEDEAGALIRRLMAIEPEIWIVVAWQQSDQTERLPRIEWQQVHRIVGKFSR